jgi:hypothetical protein
VRSIFMIINALSSMVGRNGRYDRRSSKLTRRRLVIKLVPRLRSGLLRAWCRRFIRLAAAILTDFPGVMSSESASTAGISRS